MPYIDGFMAAVAASNRQKYAGQAAVISFEDSRLETVSRACRVDSSGCRRLEQP